MKKLMTALCLLVLLTCPARVFAAAGVHVELLSGGDCDYGLHIPFTRSPRTEDYTFEVYPGTSTTGSPMVSAKVTITAAGQVTVYLPCAVDPAGPTDYTLKVTAHVVPGRAGLDREGTISKAFTSTPTCGCAAGTAGAFYAGAGTQQSPYRVSTPAQLQHLNRHLGAGLYFRQIGDIDLASYDSDSNPSNGNWTPIGSTASPFQGNYDGDGYTVSHISFFSNQNYIGLFCNSSGSIQNLGVHDSTFSAASNVGALCALSTGSIARCYAQNSSITVAGPTAGGLVAYFSGYQKIIDCYTVSCTANNSNNFSGGLVGAIDSGSILRCYALGATVSGYTPGGLVGGVQPNNQGTATISGCYWQSASASHAFGMSYAAGGLDAGCVGLAASGFAAASNLPALSIGQADSAWELPPGASHPTLKIFRTH